MNIVHVHIHVKPELIDEFISITLENARQSVKELGIARFDVFQQSDDPSKFILVEVYRSEGAPAAHKQTAHYLRWRERAEDMMVEPRCGIKFTQLFPDDADQ